MVVKVKKKVKYAMALYHKINVTRSTFFMENFMFFSKSAQFLHYAALLISKYPCQSRKILVSNVSEPSSLLSWYVSVVFVFNLACAHARFLKLMITQKMANVVCHMAPNVGHELI